MKFQGRIAQGRIDIIGVDVASRISCFINKF